VTFAAATASWTLPSATVEAINAEMRWGSSAAIDAVSGSAAVVVARVTSVCTPSVGRSFVHVP
jgi:hypothetical protein